MSETTNGGERVGSHTQQEAEATLPESWQTKDDGNDGGRGWQNKDDGNDGRRGLKRHRTAPRRPLTLGEKVVVFNSSARKAQTTTEQPASPQQPTLPQIDQAKLIAAREYMSSVDGYKIEINAAGDAMDSQRLQKLYFNGRFSWAANNPMHARLVQTLIELHAASLSFATALTILCNEAGLPSQSQGMDDNHVGCCAIIGLNTGCVVLHYWPISIQFCCWLAVVTYFLHLVPIHHSILHKMSKVTRSDLFDTSKFADWSIPTFSNFLGVAEHFFSLANEGEVMSDLLKEKYQHAICQRVKFMDIHPTTPASIQDNCPTHASAALALEEHLGEGEAKAFSASFYAWNGQLAQILDSYAATSQQLAQIQLSAGIVHDTG